MIKRAYLADELAELPPRGVEAQKIRSLLMSYGTKYDFCRFYVSESVIMCEMNGAYVVSEISEIRDISEIADFFKFAGFSEIFCSDNLGERLSRALNCNLKTISLMRCAGERETRAELDKAPNLSAVYEILKTAFDMDFETWYTDMSHRIRHGIAKARTLENSALIVQYDLNGEALLSQIATVPEKRGQGSASRLIKAVCGELSDSAVYVLCQDDLIPFYSRIGFEKADIKAFLR